MTWKKGQSGNPAGRAKKPRALGEQALRSELLAEAPAIIDAMLDLAKNGDTTAARLVLDKCLPNLRPTEPPVPIALGDLANAATSIMAAIEQGMLNPTQAASLASAVGNLIRAQESLDFEARLQQLEQAVHADRRPT